MKNFTYKNNQKDKTLRNNLNKKYTKTFIFLKESSESHERRFGKKWWSPFKSEIGSLNSFKMISVQIPIVGLFVFVKKTECKVYMEKFKYQKNASNLIKN